MDLKNTAPGSLPHSGTNNSLKSGSESTVTATLNLCNTLEQWRDGRLAQGGSPFSKIPDELCEEILVYVGVAPDPVQVKKNSSGDPPVFGWTKDLEHAVELFSPCNDPKAAIWSLSLVCARWRRIVRGCPQLYTNIKVEGIRHRKKQVWEAKKRITLVCLKLSGKLSLNLHFVASRKYWSTSPNSNDLDQEHLKKFFDSAPRWKSLIFMVQFLNWFEQPNGQEDIVHLAYPLTLPASLPYLSSIRIGYETSNYRPDAMTNIVKWPETPLTTVVHLSNLDARPDLLTTIQSQWSKITHFTSTKCLEGRGERWLSLLSQMTNLVSFTSINDSIGQIPPTLTQQVFLPNLRKMVIQNDEAFIRQVLPHFNCPNLITLELSCHAAENRLIYARPLVSHPLPHLKALIFPFQVPSSTLSKMIPFIPNLESLTLLRGIKTLKEVTALFRTNILGSRKTPFSPHLRHLRTIRIPSITLPANIVPLPYITLRKDFEQGEFELELKEIEVGTLRCSKATFDAFHEQATQWGVVLTVGKWESYSDDQEKHIDYWQGQISKLSPYPYAFF